jgi:DNA polymerase elongation subunit (family B)
MTAFSGVPMRILDFDLECRPLSWYGGDWVTKEITAIAWSWCDSRAITCVALNEDPDLFNGDLKADLSSMLYNFMAAYEAADMVSGHFIRGFDLPVINAACAELGLPTLGDKLTQDTKGDLIKFSGLSKSQENLGATLGIRSPKISMSQEDWREANRLTPKGVAKTKRRVIGDVRQHKEMRLELIKRGLLGRPKVWSATPTAGGKYVP